MPRWFNPDVWNGLVAYWQLPNSKVTSQKCSNARRTKVDGVEMSKHVSGQLSFEEQARRIVS